MLWSVKQLIGEADCRKLRFPALLLYCICAAMVGIIWNSDDSVA